MDPSWYPATRRGGQGPHIRATLGSQRDPDPLLGPTEHLEKFHLTICNILSSQWANGSLFCAICMPSAT